MSGMIFSSQGPYEHLPLWVTQDGFLRDQKIWSLHVGTVIKKWGLEMDPKVKYYWNELMNHTPISANWSLPLLLSAICPSESSYPQLPLPTELIFPAILCSKQQLWQDSRWPPSLVVVSLLFLSHQAHGFIYRPKAFSSRFATQSSIIS